MKNESAEIKRIIGMIVGVEYREMEVRLFGFLNKIGIVNCNGMQFT